MGGIFDNKLTRGRADVARVQASVCQLPHTDRGRETLIIVFSMVAVAFTAYLLRMASKLTTHNLAVEDTVITTAVVMNPALDQAILLWLTGEVSHPGPHRLC